MATITVFCGANLGNSADFGKLATDLGQWIADHHHQLIYGGGKVGLMGKLADGALSHQGDVTGIMPKFLIDREINHHGLTRFIETTNMDERKEYMLKQADYCIALPGGPGTLEEITQAISWQRVGESKATCILFNYNHYYDELRDFFTSMRQKEFVSQHDYKLIHFVNDFSELEKIIN